MKVHNPNNLPLVDYRKVKPLQGELKDLSTENYKKLAGVLSKRGFTTPLFVWNDGTDNYLMDGHQMVTDKGEYMYPNDPEIQVIYAVGKFIPKKRQE